MNLKAKKNKLTALLGIIFTFLLKANFVLALEIHYPDFFGKVLNDTSSFNEYICYLFAFGTTLIISVAVLSIAFGGVYYLVSYGRGKFTSEGKEWIKAGILGLLIVVCSSLIAYTINPSLNSCKPAFIPSINIPFFNTSTTSPGATVASYKEIPIGKLTENLLTGTMNCYGFDQKGDPVEGEQVKTDNKKDIALPTYMDHDRADCLTQLIDGAQKKAQMVASLSDEITKLMNSCSCEQYGDCQDTCGGSATCDPYPATGKCPLPAEADTSNLCLSGSCVKQPCNPPPLSNPNAPKDCCPPDSGVKDPNNPKKNLSVKDLIEHGPIKVSFDVSGGSDCPKSGCCVDTMEYAGLDEFRSSSNYTGIKALVEKTFVVKGNSVTVIDAGNCGTCKNTCYQCDPTDATCLTKCVKDYKDCMDTLNTCQSKSAWYHLKLIDQLTYLKGKIDEWSQDSKIDADQQVLDDARDTLSKCYLAMPYVDVFKTVETTDKNNRVILKDPSPVDVSTYCSGFNYNNSSCLEKCNSLCPDKSPKVMQCYQKCGTCQTGDTRCQTKQEACIEKCYNDRSCIYNSVDASQTFNKDGDSSSCIASCQDDCATKCEDKYLPCSPEYIFCQSQCKNNGQCVLDNAGSCLFGAGDFQQCASQITDQGNVDFCINNAYLCKNGSDQYAGYPDCMPPTSIDCSSVKTKAGCEAKASCAWDGIKCSQNYSASFLYNKDYPYQICRYPYIEPAMGTFCYSDKAQAGASCQDLCPQTTKCPTSSDCPTCSCDQINQNIPFFIPNDSVPDRKGKNKKNFNAGSEGYNATNKQVSAYQIVSPQCNEYSYNDDPLTFYCEDSWWNDLKRESENIEPTGTEKIIDLQQSGEVPVGQTVDAARDWAITLMMNKNNISKDIKPIIDKMKQMGEAKNPTITNMVKDYCKCNAKLETGDPICTAGCGYSQALLPVVNPDTGDPTGDYAWSCGCKFVPCNGNPCEQMVDYHSQLWNAYKQLKTDFMDFYTRMLKEPRSDILKQLTYSRNTASECSVKNIAYGVKNRLVSCTRVQDELISPINNSAIQFNNKNFKGYCYGIQLGKDAVQPTPPALPLSLTDNWFCLEEYSTNPAVNNNPIYNIRK